MKKYIFPIIITLSALSVSASAAFYSVSGLSKLFAGAQLEVIIMTGSLEVAKLIISSLLYQYRKTLPKLLKSYLIIACTVLILITSMGVYGFLSAAYQETAHKESNTLAQIELLETKRDNVKEQLEVYTEEKSSINEAVSELRKGLSNNKIQWRDRETNQIITSTSSSTRRALEKQLDNSMARRDTLSKKEQALSDSISTIDLKVLDLETNSEVAAEIGPLKYVAKITGKDIDRVVNWFILLFIFVFDPLAVMLLVSANKALYNLKPKENIYGEIKITKKPLPPKPPKIIKSKIDKADIQRKRDEINRQIQKVLNSGLSEKRRNIQLQNLKNQLPKDDEDLSKEY